jgi:hypothetical protein
MLRAVRLQDIQAPSFPMPADLAAPAVRAAVAILFVRMHSFEAAVSDSVPVRVTGASR